MKDKTHGGSAQDIYGIGLNETLHFFIKHNNTPAR